MINEYGIKDMNDVHEFVKMLTAETIQAALDAELDSELGYTKYDYKNKQTDNSRNGYSAKTVQGNMGELEIQVPRDRNGEFEPQLVKKHQTDVSSIEDKIIFLYSQGISTRDIQKTMQEMYGIDVDDSRVSKSVYAMIILDAVHYNVRGNGIVTKKAAYVAIGTDLDGKKDVLGIWLGASESSKYWISVLNGLKSRGCRIY
jgi:transposase-like protein